MSVKNSAKISFRRKTHDCQYCQFQTAKRIPNTDIFVNFCLIDMPKKVYQLRGLSTVNCKEFKPLHLYKKIK